MPASETLPPKRSAKGMFTDEHAGCHLRSKQVSPARQAGYKTAAYLNQHTNKDLGKQSVSV